MPVIRGDRPESRILIVDNDFIWIRLEDIRVYRINSRSSIADRIVDFRKLKLCDVGRLCEILVFIEILAGRSSLIILISRASPAGIM